MRNNLKNKILNTFNGYNSSLEADAAFEKLALEVFEYQYKYNAFYQRYCSLIGKEPSKIKHLFEIPFLPIQFFKNNIIKTGIWHEEAIFSSSGTTGNTTSQHFVRELDFYKTIARKGFEFYYGAVTEFCVLGLLPSYLERSGSSLIAMVDDFIQYSKYEQSGFFLYDLEKLKDILQKNNITKTSTLLIGVSFALWDFIEKYQLNFPELIVMETGGMKGRRRELIRSELHDILCKGFNTPSIHSEYGMTELMSQGYSKGKGIFQPIPTMRVLTRDLNDPLSVINYTENASPNHARLGVINVIDLGNLDSCSFIATDDLGRVYSDNTFEILGRLDNSDIRGCNLMVNS